MLLVQQSKDRLRVVALSLDRAFSFAVLDRRNNQARVFSTALAPSSRYRVMRLSDFVSVLIGKREHTDGSASYSAVLRLQGGESLKFACRTRDEAVQLMRTLAKFLKLE